MHIDDATARVECPVALPENPLRVDRTSYREVFMAARLRVFPDAPEDRSDNQEATIRVSLADLLPLVALAKHHNYLWLQDFLDDEVSITPDLYDVLRAFNNYRRPSA
jgi:hypothetical protein